MLLGDVGMDVGADEGSEMQYVWRSSSSVYFPVGQASHVERPIPLLYVSAGHSSQATIPVRGA